MWAPTLERESGHEMYWEKNRKGSFSTTHIHKDTLTYVCICIYIHRHTYWCTYTICNTLVSCVLLPTVIWVNRYWYIYVYKYTHIYANIHTYIHTYKWIYICIPSVIFAKIYHPRSFLVADFQPQYHTFSWFAWVCPCNILQHAVLAIYCNTL